MNSKVETQESRLDTLKLGTAVFVIAATIIAFYYFAGHSLLIRVLGLLAGAGVALAIVLQTELGQRSRGMIQDARAEVRKVVWPSRAETMQTTLAVIVMVLIMGVLLWIIDMFLAWGVKIVSGIGS